MNDVKLVIATSGGGEAVAEAAGRMRENDALHQSFRDFVNGSADEGCNSTALAKELERTIETEQVKLNEALEEAKEVVRKRESTVDGEQAPSVRKDDAVDELDVDLGVKLFVCRPSALLPPLPVSTACLKSGDFHRYRRAVEYSAGSAQSEGSRVGEVECRLMVFAKSRKALKPLQNNGGGTTTASPAASTKLEKMDEQLNELQRLGEKLDRHRLLQKKVAQRRY